MSDPQVPRVVSVEIYGQRYPIRSALDPDYVVALAKYVDEKMRAADQETPAGDSVKIAVLAAINIADEYFRCRDADQWQGGEVLRRAEALEKLVDAVLQGQHAAGSGQ